ncbi:MAG: hypothetical protein ACP5VR_05620 [Acidimicrobiales bacterium]
MSAFGRASTQGGAWALGSHLGATGPGEAPANVGLVLRDWDLRPDVEALLRALGTDPGRARKRPSVVEVARQALVAAEGLLQPAVVAASYAVEGLSHERLRLGEGRYLAGPLVAKQLHRAEHVLVAICTVGPALEAAASECSGRDLALSAALDALGTAAVDLLVAALCQTVGDQAKAGGSLTTTPFSPGMVGWPLAAGQRQIFSLVDAASIGVSLTESFMMLPQKSTSLVVGIGGDLGRSGEPCDYCAVAATCRYRQRRAPSIA